MLDTKYILDAYAILEIGHLPSSECSQILNLMTDLSKSKCVRFPATVWKQVHLFDAEGTAAVWVKAATDTASSDNISYMWEQGVLHDCPELVDSEAYEDEWQSAPKVAALARALMADGETVAVVTGDYQDRPDRLCLLDACAQLRIHAIHPSAFVQILRGSSTSTNA